MNAEEFRVSVADEKPPHGLPVPLEALWWDAKGDWTRSHALVDELETKDGMAVHAYLHRKDGQLPNADYCTAVLDGSSSGLHLRQNGTLWSRRWCPVQDHLDSGLSGLDRWYTAVVEA